MESEALRKVRTLRQVRTGLDISRERPVRTTNDLSRTRDEKEYLQNLTHPFLSRVLEKERRRFAAGEAAVRKSQQRMLRARHKLAMTLNQNRALTELRRELQRARWKGISPPSAQSAARGAPERKPRRIELEY